MALVLGATAVVSSICTLAASKVLAGKKQKSTKVQEVRCCRWGGVSGGAVACRSFWRPAANVATDPPFQEESKPSHSDDHWLPGVERVGVLGNLIVCVPPRACQAAAAASHA